MSSFSLSQTPYRHISGRLQIPHKTTKALQSEVSAAAQKSVFRSQHLNIFLDFRDWKILCQLFWLLIHHKPLNGKAKFTYFVRAHFAQVLRIQTPPARHSAWSWFQTPVSNIKMDMNAFEIMPNHCPGLRRWRRKEKILTQAVMKKDILAIVLFCVFKVNLLVSWTVFIQWQFYLIDIICHSHACGEKLVSSISVRNHVKTNAKNIVAVSNKLPWLKPVIFTSWATISLDCGQMTKSFARCCKYLLAINTLHKYTECLWGSGIKTTFLQITIHKKALETCSWSMFTTLM